MKKTPAEGYQDRAWLDETFGKTDEPPAQLGKPVKYPLLFDDQLETVQSVEWLIAGILPARGTSILYGPPGKGKTFLGLDWSLSVATGLSWHGREVTRGDTVYVAAEGWNGIKDRVAAWKSYNEVFGGDRCGVAFLGRPIRLLDPRDVTDFGDSIEGTGLAPALIVIDTLSRNAAGLDENSAVDMGKIVSACDELRVRFDSAVLLVHHPTKGGQTQPTLRGHGSLNGAADMVAKFGEADEEGVLYLKNDKMKDHAPFPKIRFKLQPVNNSVVLVDADKKSRQVQQEEAFP